LRHNPAKPLETPMPSIILATLMLALAGLPAAAVAQGDAYPVRPIRMVVPFPPGGTSDIMGRLIAVKLSEQLGQPVVVDNRGGANGNIGSNLVAKAEPDGYTLVLSGVGSHAINQSLYRSMPHNVVTDFTHIGMIAKGPNTLVVNPDFEARTLKQLVEIARARPGKLSYASSANGSSNHLSMEMLKSVAGLDITHIPYKGGGPAITDVMAGHVPMMFINFDAALPYVQAGKLRALAMTGTERSPALPDTPTVAESGYPNFAAESWTGVSGPPKMPAAVVARLNAEIVKAVQTPEVTEKLSGLGLTPVLYSPRQMSDFVAAEVEKWGRAVKASGAQVD
jgi:tripartite-type tricarboxylate transporter receptor subunit TctC